jgi:hypothetical protein
MVFPVFVSNRTVTECTVRVSESVAIIESYDRKYNVEQRPLPAGNVISLPAPHRSLRAKAHDTMSEFERDYPW